MRMRFSRHSIIEPQELSDLLSAGEKVRLIDASWGGQPVYPYTHIHNAVYFDIDTIADIKHPLPHMLPDAKGFANAMGEMGISNDNTIVVYDQNGIHLAAARAWWMFRCFGHENVYVLNGGLPYWNHLGLPVNDIPVVFEKTEYNAVLRQDLVADSKDVMRAIDDNNTEIIDARAPDRFNGLLSEGGGRLLSGHMPGAKNLFFLNLMDQATAGLKPVTELESILKPYKDTPHLISTCGSGVTACVLAVAMYDVYQKDVTIYDASWSEWGQESLRLPVTR